MIKKTIVALIMLMSLQAQASADAILRGIGAGYETNAYTFTSSITGNKLSVTEHGQSIVFWKGWEKLGSRLNFAFYDLHYVYAGDLYYYLWQQNGFTLGAGGGFYLDDYKGTNKFIDLKGLNLSLNARYKPKDLPVYVDATAKTRVTGLDFFESSSNYSMSIGFMW